MVFMPHWPIKWNRFPKRVDLAPMLTLLKHLGNPHKNIQNIIHVAGTNGKGSSCAFLESIIKEHGYSTNKYTSPHLLEFNERIKINNAEISDEYLFEIIEKIRLISESKGLDNSFFEITSAACFIAFAENNADFTIIETGMGGRLDATNIFQHPIATLITPISYDHQEYLGPTLPIIANEKAAIIKHKTPCIIGPQNEDIFEILFAKCEKEKAPAIAYSYDYTISKTDKGFLYEGHKLTHDFSKPSLLGDHQMLNATTSITAILEILEDTLPQKIDHALQKTFWPARLQKIKYKDMNIYIEGAHNEAGAKALSIWIKENFDHPVPLILGMTDNRDVAQFTKYFENLTNVIYCVQVNSEACSFTSEKLASLVPQKLNPIEACHIEEALQGARGLSSDVIVTGSLFLASDMLKMLR